ncbi:TPA: hypothetical protein N0F65_011270 [Lagenidium giganteum]|uniref:GAG-pre-integrase domain-containing protein n=1 Tax=Lagenidium giganteum TaxID=4803 RepID=A0AAV2YXY1_9STRA|nr:TPA: hypothetical protein N0F65_011270 [Lagenidium giganteum]
MRTKVDQIGTVELTMRNHHTGRFETYHLRDAWYAPSSQVNLISWGVMREKGYRMSLSYNQLTTYLTKDGFTDDGGTPTRSDFRDYTSPADVKTWHKRLTHASKQVVEDMVKSGALDDLNLSKADSYSRLC